MCLWDLGSCEGSRRRQILRDGCLLEAYVAAVPLAAPETRGCLSWRATVIPSDDRNIWSGGGEMQLFSK